MQDTVKEKGQEEHRQRDGGQVLMAVAEVMFELVALPLEHVESLVFDFPPRSPAIRYLLDRL